MTTTAILFLALALLIIWGGLVASIVFLVRFPEVTHFPPGGEAEDDLGDD